MMKKSILIIDDEEAQATGLRKALSEKLPDVEFISAHAESDIIKSIEDKFYSLAIVDLRMDNYQFDGITIINKIITENPFANIVVISAFTEEYIAKLKQIMVTGKVVDVLPKESFDIWVPKIVSTITNYYKTIDNNPSLLSAALLQYYAEAKNDTDTYKKGEKFEHFVSLLFGNIGYKDIKQRVIDASHNEVDLIIRNEINDSFLNKLGNYFLVECKNKPGTSIGKNDFIIFNNKLVATNGLANMGFIFTTGYISKTTYMEAIRTSKGRQKIAFFSNPEIERLINAPDIKSEFKCIIDDQVKNH